MKEYRIIKPGKNWKVILRDDHKTEQVRVNTQTFGTFKEAFLEACKLNKEALRSPNQ